MNVPREASLEYLAAVLDVKGTIHMRHDRNYHYLVLRIDGPRTLLEMFSAHFGGAISTMPSRKSPYWMKSGQGCQRVLAELRPYMRVKTAEVDKILAWVSKEPWKAAGPQSRVNKIAAEKAAAALQNLPPVTITRAPPCEPWPFPVWGKQLER